MAKALQCPNCGHRHPLAGVADRSSFACVSCGQVLKVPAAYRRKPSEGARPVASSAAPAPAPAPRPRDATQTMDRAAVAAAAAAAGAGAVASTPPPPPPGSLLGGSRTARRDAAAGASLGRWARFLVWLVSIPIAFVIVIVPARLAHYITGANLVGVVAGTGAGRFLRLAVITLIWAFAAAALVTIIVTMIERRRSRPSGDPARRRGGGHGSGPPSDGGVVRGGSAASRASRPSGSTRQPVAGS